MSARTKTRAFQARTTEAQYRAIERAAKERGLSLTEYFLATTAYHGTRAALLQEITGLVHRIASGREKDVVGALSVEVAKLDELVRVRDELAKLRDYFKAQDEQIAAQRAEQMRDLRRLFAEIDPEGIEQLLKHAEKGAQEKNK
jgi:uncharacterized protein (DUF1778 family)